jgi:signal transduction histidine kinase
LDWLEPFENRTERTIAVARLGLAAAALLAIWLDPTQPARAEAIAYGLLAVFAAYAAALVGVAWRPRPPPRRLGLAGHLVDLVVFTALMHLTEGPTSPFFLFLGYSLIAATLRWSWPGTLGTAAFASAVILAFTLLGALAGPADELELNRVTTRLAWIGVAALLLAFMAAHQDRLRAMLWRLARQPASLSRDAAADIDTALARMADLFAVPRVLLATSEPEEPWLDLVLLEDGRARRRREPPDRLEPLVDPDLAGTAFLAFEAMGDGITLRRAGDDVTPWPGRPLHEALCRELAIRSVIALPVRTAEAESWLLLLDRPDFTSDDLLLGEIAAGQLAALLDQMTLLRRLQAVAATEARVAVARDLHDGVLQALAGTALQLQSVADRLPQDPAAARARLVAIQEALGREQRELRGFIELLRPAADAAPDPARPLAAELGPLAEHLARQWSLEVRLAVEPPGLALDGRRAAAIARLVAEAVANAGRHGAARTVRITVSGDGDALALRIADDGRGLAWRGRRSAAELARHGLGPRSLAERVAGLGGHLAIESGETGATLEITLPLGPPAREPGR